MIGLSHNDEIRKKFFERYPMVRVMDVEFDNVSPEGTVTEVYSYEAEITGATVWEKDGGKSFFRFDGSEWRFAGSKC